VGDVGRAAVCGKLGETAPINLEEIDDLAKPPLDLAIDIGRRQAAERERLLREECLEAKPLGQRQLGVLALQSAGKDLTEVLELLYQICSCRTESKDSTPRMGPPALRGSDRYERVPML
jgi:hypothetical protein